MSEIIQLRNAFLSQTLPRDEFWQRMAKAHASLRAYQTLLEQSEIAKIEIDSQELRVVTQDGVRLVWDPEDIRSASSVALNHGAYEPEEGEFLLRIGRDARCILDIGANTGWYSLRIAIGRNTETMQIHAFEPVPHTFSRLSRNIFLNGMEKVIHARSMGLSNRPGVFRMYCPDNSGTVAASLHNLHPNENSKEVDCQFSTLDLYAMENKLDHIDLIKVDVEGAELFVIQGGMETLKRHRPIVFLELLRKWSSSFGYHPNDVIAIMKRNGYECWTFNGHRLIPFMTMTDDTKQTNFIFADPYKHQTLISQF